jgi:hypothetical protein
MLPDARMLLDAMVSASPMAHIGPPIRSALTPPKRWELDSLRLYRIRWSQYRRNIRVSRLVTPSSISSGGR